MVRGCETESAAGFLADTGSGQGQILACPVDSYLVVQEGKQFAQRYCPSGVRCLYSHAHLNKLQRSRLFLLQ